MTYEAEQRLLWGAFYTIVFFFSVLLFGAALDSFQEYRAFDARAACMGVRTTPLRKPFTTDVRCVRPASRADSVEVGGVR